MAENLREKLDRIDLKCIDEDLRFYDLRSLFEATAPRLSPEDKEEVKKVIQNTDDAETIAAVLMAKAGDKKESLEEDNLDEALYNYYMIDFKDVDDGRRYSEEYSGWDSKDALEMFRIDYPESEGYKILAIYKLTDEGYERIDSLFDEFLEEASYGGAYDIEDDMYFTKDDLMEFIDILVSKLEDNFGYSFEVYNTGFDTPSQLYIELVDTVHDILADHVFHIDMRRIRKPQDLQKYIPEISSYFIQEFQDLYNQYEFDESLNEEKKRLNNREKKVYIDIIEKCEDRDDLEDIIHEIFFYDKALFAMLRHFPKDASFEELKSNKIAILKDSMLDEKLNEALWNNYLIEFKDLDDGKIYSEEYEAYDRKEAIELFRKDYSESDNYKLLHVYKLTDEGWEETYYNYDESLNEDLIISPNKEYMSKSGHRLVVKEVDPYISEYDGTANLRIKYDYKLKNSNKWGSSECNHKDFFNMLKEDWNIEDQIDAPDTIGKLNPGDKFKNRNGVEITIVEPQKDGTIQYKIDDEVRAGSERSIQRMLYKNNYLREDYNSFLTLADNDANKLRNEYDKGDKSIFDILTSLNYVQDDPDSVYMYKEVSDGYAIVFDLSSYDEGKNYVKYFVVDENNNIPKGYTITKLLIEDYQHDKDEWGDPYSYDEVERELKNITNDWTDKEGTIRCYWEQEKNYGMQILQKHYDIVEPSDGRTGSGEEMSWVLAYSRPKEELKESLNESVTSNLQDKIIDCLDWFILMEMEFPKDKFLADSWEDVKDGIQMGIDPEFEVAEGIIEYLKPIITFNKKYNKEVGEEGVFQDEIEMYQSLVRAMNNYLAKNGYEDRIEEDFSFEDNVTQMKDLMGQNSNLFNKMIDDVETPKKDNRIFKFLKRKEK